MLKIESNLKINGRHWGLQFTNGIAYTANVALAAKLLLKGYVVTGQPDQPVAGSTDTKQEITSTSSSPAQEDIHQAIQSPVSNPGNVVSNATVKAAKPSTTKSRTKAVKPHAVDAN